MTETPHPDPETPESGPPREPDAPADAADTTSAAAEAADESNATPLPEAKPPRTDEPLPDTRPAAHSDNADDDAAQIADSPEHPDGQHPVDSTLIDWANECSPRTVAVELKRVEQQVRQLLEDRDPRRKRKLAGSRRWSELHDDILTWRYASRLDEQTLRDLERLVSRRHYLFQRLRFLACTRPTWNT